MSPYRFEDLECAGFHGIYKSLPGESVSLINGKDRTKKLPEHVRTKLSTVSNKQKADPSVRDHHVMLLLLESGLSAADCYATFLASARGEDARARGHDLRWVERSLQSAVSQHTSGKKGVPIKNGGRVITVDFTGISSTRPKEEKSEDGLEDVEVLDWRKEFKSKNQLDQMPLAFAVERLIPEEGIIGIGGLSGHAKTWVMMSVAKRMMTGGYLWGQLKTNQYPVVYLIPEAGDRSFFHRMKRLHIPDSEQFLVRTMSQGKTLPLASAVMQAAVKGRMVFLDTLPRFTEGKDEQQARDMAALSENLLGLLQAGAVSVVFAHHSPKNSKGENLMNLENVFRGSGDIGAILSAGHGVRILDESKLLIQVECVKPRDFEALKPFQLEGRPWINREGDFHMVKKPGECDSLAGEKKKQASGDLCARLLKVIRANPGLSGNKIAEEVSGNRNQIYSILESEIGRLWKVEETRKSKHYYALKLGLYQYQYQYQYWTCIIPHYSGIQIQDVHLIQVVQKEKTQ